MPQIDDDLLARVKALVDNLDDVQVPRPYSKEARALKALLDPPVDADLALARSICADQSLSPRQRWISGDFDHTSQMFIAREAIRRARKLEAQECARIAAESQQYQQRDAQRAVACGIKISILQRSADHG